MHHSYDKQLKLIMRLLMSFVVLVFANHAAPSGNNPTAKQPDKALWQMLNEAEKHYLTEHPVISAQSENDFPPINFIENDHPSGFSIDFMRLLGAKLGVEINFIGGHDWSEFMTMVKSGELDLITNIVKSSEREKSLLFSNPVSNVFWSIASLNDRQFELDTLQKLRGKTLAVTRGYFEEAIIRKHFPAIDIKLVTNSLEGLSLVAAGEVDASLQDHSTANYLIAQHRFSGLVVTNVTEEPRVPILSHHIATAKNNPLLQGIINKAIRFISEQQLIKLRTRWYGFSATELKAKAGKTLLLSQLNDAEKQYLAQHPMISVQNEDDYPPFNYTVNGRPNGYSIDFIHLVTQRLGIKANFIQNKKWAAYVDMLKTKELDAVLNMMATEERRRFANFTTPYAELSFVSVTRKGEAEIVASTHSLSSKRIAIIDGQGTSQSLRDEFSKAVFIPVKDMQAALRTVSTGGADVAFATEAVAGYFIERHFITGLEFAPIPASLDMTVLPLRIATHKDNLLLAGLLQKSMNSFSEQKLMQLRKKWLFSGQPDMPKVALTQQERQYLDTKNTIKVNRGENYPPLTFVTNDAEQGYTVDLLRYVAKILDLKLEFISGTWSQHLQKMQRGELDLLLDVTNTPARRKIFRFTQPYVEYRNVVAMSANRHFAEVSFDELKGETVAAMKDWSISLHLEKHYPQIKLLYVDSPLDALMAVSTGKADAHVVSEILANYLIQKHFITNLQNMPLVESTRNSTEAHSFAVRHDKQLLRGIIDKALLAVSETKLIALRQKWLGSQNNISRSSAKLSKRQRQWMLSHSQPTLYLPEFGLPVGQSSKQGYTGLVADFTSYLEGLLVTQWLPQNRTDKRATTTDANDADIAIGNPLDPQLKDRFDFSTPIINMPVVMLTGNPKRVYVDELAELTDVKTGIMSDASYLTQVQTQYPTLQLQQFASMAAAVLAVNSGDVDILLCPLAHCSYLMDELGANNVRIVGQTAFFNTLSYAVRKDWPELLHIINTTLSAMSPQRKNSIYKHWNNREDLLVKVDNSQFWYLLIVAVSIIVCGIIWNRKIANYAYTIEVAHEELKNTQSQLVQAEKMASLGSLTAGVAHEINNPTNFVHVGAQNLAVDLALCRQYIFKLAGEDAEQKVLDGFHEHFDPLFEHLKTIKDGTERIKVIVQDLRAFTRLDKTAKTSIDIAVCIQSTINLVRTKYLEVTEFITDIKPTPELSCFPAQINQVLMNLIVNACYAIKDKQLAEKSSELGKIAITCQIVENDIEIAIADDGCGMNEETKNKLFEPFFTTKSVGEGTGLGMAISFGIIEEHQGSIAVESTLGVGTTIRVRLPVI